jgi:hypothetical protein
VRTSPAAATILRIAALASLAALAAATSACTAVQPWDRDLHARADMQPDAHDAAIDDHIYFSKEASSGGRGFAGGGCGCN